MSARVHASYILRSDEYSRDASEVVYSESANLPEWASDAKDFWSASDEHERANGRVYREIEFALPRELDQEEQIRLAREFAQDVTWEHGLAYTLAVHEGRGSNPHAHLMLCEREYDGVERSREQFFKRANKTEPEKGGAAKVKELTRRDWVEKVRETWEVNANAALEQKRTPERIDRRSYERQGVEKIPQIHLGRPATQAMRQDLEHPRVERYEAIQAQRELVELGRRGQEIDQRREAVQARIEVIRQARRPEDGRRIRGVEAARGSAPGDGEAVERARGESGVSRGADEGHGGAARLGDEFGQGSPGAVGLDDRELEAVRVVAGDVEREVEQARVGSAGDVRDVQGAGGRAREEEPGVGQDLDEGKQAARGAQNTVGLDPDAGGAGGGGALDQGARARGAEREEPRAGRAGEVLPGEGRKAGRGRKEEAAREAEPPGRDPGTGVRPRAPEAKEDQGAKKVEEARPKEKLSPSGMARVLEALEDARRRREELDAKRKAMRERPRVDTRSEEQKRYEAQVMARAQAVRERRAQEKAEQERQRAEQERARRAEQERQERLRAEQMKKPSVWDVEAQLEARGQSLVVVQEEGIRCYGRVEETLDLRSGTYIKVELDRKKHPDAVTHVLVNTKDFRQQDLPKEGQNVELYKRKDRMVVHDRDRGRSRERDISDDWGR